MIMECGQFLMVEKIPECDQTGCHEPGCYRLVWNDQQHYCEPHCRKVLGVAMVMGYKVPFHTLTLLQVRSEDQNQRPVITGG